MASARLTARLATAALTAAALLAPAVVLAPASAVISPWASCADVAADVPGAVDGTYQITVVGQTLDVWCADMATTPAEYLTLPSSGPGMNFSQSNFGGTLVETHFTRLSLNLPTDASLPFTVDVNDGRFSSTTGSATPWRYAAGGSCGWRSTSLNVDLRGTSFGVATSDFQYGGWIPGGTITPSSGSQVVDVTNARGDCGGIQTPDPTALIWLGAVAPVVTGPADVTVASGDDATFTASATGDPVISAQWQSSTDGTTWSDLTGETSTTLTLPAVGLADDGLLVRILFTNAEGTAPSSAATLTVNPWGPTTTDPSDQTVTSGDDATFSITVDGDPTPTVQWQSSSDGGTTWTDVTGETTTDLVLLAVTTADDGLLVRAVVTNAASTVTSGTALLTVDPWGPDATDPADVTVAPGDDATFSITVDGDPTPTVQWQSSTDGSTWTDVTGATGTDLVLADVTMADDGTWVQARVTNANGSRTTGSALLTVQGTPPTVTTAPLAVTAALGTDATFTLTVTGNPTPTIQWQTSVDGYAYTDVVGANGTSLTLTQVTAAQNGLYVRAYLSSDAGAAATEGVRLTVVSPVAPAAAAAAGISRGLAATGLDAGALGALTVALLVSGAGAVVVARRRSTLG